MTLAVKEKLRQAVRGGLICSQTVHGRGIKFWRTNRSYLGKGWQWWKGSKELSKQRNGECKDPGAGEGTEHLRTWTKSRLADHTEQTGSGPTWDGKGKPLDVFKQGTDMIRSVLYITHDALWRMNQRGPNSKWKDQHGRRERKRK